MKPTLDEMKLLVAKMLPEHLHIHPPQTYVAGVLVKQQVHVGETVVWNDTGILITDREWLHVCWLAEETLTDLQWALYDSAICRVDSAKMRHCGRIGVHLHASAETKIEALCRAVFPDKMKPAHDLLSLSGAWYTVMGEQYLHAAIPFEVTGFDDLIGREILANGVHCRISGVEHFTLAFPWRPGFEVGLKLTPIL